MGRIRGLGLALSVVLFLGLSLGVALGLAAQSGEKHYARVENQTSDTIFLSYKEVVSGNSAKVQVQVYPGESRRLDLRNLQGEVCAWGGKEYEPTKKLGCRTLQAGDIWVIH